MTTLRKQAELRVAAIAAASFKVIEGAGSMEAVLSGKLEDKGCYIFRESNKADKNAMTSVVRQKRTETIAFVVVSRNVRTGGADSSDDNEALCDAIQSAILGYEPAGGYTPFEYSGGGLVKFINGFMIWREAYSSAKTIRSA